MRGGVTRLGECASARPELCSFLVVVNGPREPRECDGKCHACGQRRSGTSSALITLPSQGKLLA